MFLKLKEINYKNFILFIRWILKWNVWYGCCYVNFMVVGYLLFFCGGVLIDRLLFDLEFISVVDVDEYDVIIDIWVFKICLLKERYDVCCVKFGMYIYIKINVKKNYKFCEIIFIF